MEQQQSSNELPKTYDCESAQAKWYSRWESGGYFKARPSRIGKSYSIVMPPPNVTGQLHMGHALDITTQDALIRFYRMKGYATLFLPGTDHAGIATQAVVEKLVWDQEKKTRHDYGRDAFIKKIWEWKETYGNIINKQQRAMGASPDWDYFTFTMDPASNEAVRHAFVTLYNEGLIYRDEYIVNWDTELQSAISDAEVEHVEVKGAIYKIKYPLKGTSDHLIVATTRPETVLGDTAICVNPKDERYQHLIGKTAIVPVCNSEIPIIADEYVDMDFGTGCLKVTPGHDFNDFEIGKRHSLPIINILNKDGTLNEHGGELQGLKCKPARAKFVKTLEELGLLVDVQDHVHMVGHGDRSKIVIEPLVSKQWFLNVQEMAKRAYDSVKNDTTRFFPKSWENTYFSWLKEPKNWCISRQLWWGHRIPVYTCKKCQHEWADQVEATSCPKCQSSDLQQDLDVLDTWFSSGLWPMTMLGWPDKKRMEEKKFNTFFPTSVLVTGYDIIFFWVARMMMFSLKFTNQIPFHHVYIHAIVRDKLGRKMSKSLGNGIDPLEMIQKYGTDALRFTLASGSGYNRNLNLDPERIEGFRNFINKVWNAYRFISPHLAEASLSYDKLSLDHHERWILSELGQTIVSMNASMAEYRFDDSCQTIYAFVYDKFCSWFIELSKPILNGTDEEAKRRRSTVLKFTFRQMLKLMHPFTPYITEEIWSFLKTDSEDLLTIQEYPEVNEWNYPEDLSQMGTFVETISSIRFLRTSANLKPKEEVSVCLYVSDPKLQAYFAANKKNFFELARVKDLVINPEVRPKKSITMPLGHTEIYLILENLANIEEHVLRLENELAKTITELAKYNMKLDNPKFMENAPANVLLEVRSNQEALSLKLKSIRETLERFRG